MSHNKSASDMFYATTLLLSDWPTARADALLFHARARGDDDGLFGLATEFVNNGLAELVVINGSDGERIGGSSPCVAWPGKTAYIERLVKAGVPKEKIFCSRPAFHTKDENEAFLDIAVVNGWRSGIIISQPHQLLRAFLGFIKSMADRTYWMRTYAASPKSVLWHKKVFGSQATESKPRLEHIDDEFRRIFLYQEKGDLTDFEELFKYFLLREKNELF